MNQNEIVKAFLSWLNINKADDGKRRPMKIQSLIFSKDKFKSADEARAWAAKHKFRDADVDETGSSFRLRQKNPGGFKKMRTIELTDGVKAVVGKGSPTRSDVHVPTTEVPAEHKQEVRLDKTVEAPDPVPQDKKVTKDTNEDQHETDVDSGGRSSGGLGDNALAGMYSMQSIVDGMDWELEHDTTDPDLAKEMAIANLEDDPQHYNKLRNMDDGVDWSSAFGFHETEGDHPNFRVDVGSGPEREKGYLGLDLQKHDHGTIVHDVHMGLPFPDESASHVLLRNSLAYMDKLSDDPKPLLSEIQRILMPGGQFVYEGPNQIQNQPEWLKETWSEKFNHVDQRGAENASRVGKIEGQPMFRQEFARLAVPDAATANDSEPRIGIAQYDMLPADALLAMDALGYYWSDATSSGRGNRLHGYPSQGALVKSDDDMMVEAALNAPLDEEMQGEQVRQRARKECAIFKADRMKQLVYGVVLAPNEIDLQDDTMDPEEIEKTAHFYMANSRTAGDSHEKEAKAIPVESYIAPVDFQFDGQYGNQTVKKGSWVIGMKVLDPEIWQKILDGEYTGFSVGGWGQRSDVPADQAIAQQW